MFIKAFKSRFKKGRVSILLWLLGIVLIALFAAMQYSMLRKFNRPLPLTPDSRQGLSNAYKISKEGILSQNVHYRREPLYPMLLAGTVLSMPVKFRDAFWDDMRKGREIRKSVRPFFYLLNSTLLGLTLLGTFVSARMLTRNWLAPYLALAIIMLGDYFYFWSLLTELPAALFLVWYSLFFMLGLKRKSVILLLSASIFLGFLILTKALYQYLLPLGIIFAFALLYKLPFKKKVTLLFALFIPCYIIVVGWMWRNWIVFDDFIIAGRGDEVLAVRAEFDTMAFREYLYFYILCSPEELTFLKSIKVPKSTYERLLSREPKVSYAKKGKNGGGVVWKVMADEYPHLDKPEAMKKAAFKTIIRNFPMHIMTTFVFGYRGAFMKPRPYVLSSSDTFMNKVIEYNVRISRYLRLFLVPSFLICLAAYAMKRKYWCLAFFLGASYSYFMHAFFTHFISRYSIPLVPIFAVATGIAICCILAWGCKIATFLIKRWKAVPVPADIGGMDSKPSSGTAT